MTVTKFHLRESIISNEWPIKDSRLECLPPCKYCGELPILSEFVGKDHRPEGIGDIKCPKCNGIRYHFSGKCGIKKKQAAQAWADEMELSLAEQIEQLKKHPTGGIVHE